MVILYFPIEEKVGVRVHMTIRQGLDIPLMGSADPQDLQTLAPSSRVGLNVDYLAGKNGLRPLVKEGDYVLRGQPVFEDKEYPGRMIVACASGKIESIVRGERRVIQQIIIARDAVAGGSATGDEAMKYTSVSTNLSRELLLQEMMSRGLMSHIRQRPFNRVADPTKMARSIFVKALESAPMVPQPDEQITQHAKAFQEGLLYLKKLTEGPVHLVHRLDSCAAISQATGVVHHTVAGPHPCANPSVHIHHIDPIETLDDCVWTLSAWDVLVIGASLSSGSYFCERIVAIAGEGIAEKRRSYIKTHVGVPINELVAGRLLSENGRIVSGDPLMGTLKTSEDFLDMQHACVCVIPYSEGRQLLHFFRPGFDKFTASGGYLSSLLKNQLFHFTTHQHGEPRAFIDAAVYDRVMPMQIPTMHLIKAVICEDYDKAQELGLLEVDAEDFALASFICPSKIEIALIIQQALKRWACELL